MRPRPSLQILLARLTLVAPWRQPKISPPQTGSERKTRFLPISKFSLYDSQHSCTGSKLTPTMTSDKRENPPTGDTHMEDANRPSGFTAVNGAVGRESPRTNGNTEAREHVNPVPAEASPRLNGPTQPKSSTVSQSASPSTAGTPAEALRNGTPASLESPPTRKRSYPDAFGDSEGRAYYSKVADNETRNEIQPRGLDSYPPPRQEPPETPDQHRQHHERQRPLASEYDPHASVPHPYYEQSASGGHGDIERRVVEALGSHSDDPHGHGNAYESPDPDDMGSQTHYGEYTTSRSGAVQVDGDRKRRKRVFSNRTKTGCMTCRKRKKKCDEQKPECEFHQKFVAFPRSIILSAPQQHAFQRRLCCTPKRGESARCHFGPIRQGA